MELETQLTTITHKTLLTIHTPLTKKQQEDLEQQRLYIPIHKFTNKGTPKWRPTLLQLAQQYKQHYHLPQATFATTYNTLSSSETVLFSCPMAHQRVANQQVFSVKNPSRAVWCPTCRHSWGGRKWICACGKSWAECPTHYNGIP
eukprot:570045-Karenia_brevis.AAC.1